MKVSLYVREHGSRQYRKYNPKRSYPFDTIWVLRYGTTWENVTRSNRNNAAKRSV
jgi:hypothetical protein